MLVFLHALQVMFFIVLVDGCALWGERLPAPFLFVHRGIGVLVPHHAFGFALGTNDRDAYFLVVPLCFLQCVVISPVPVVFAVLLCFSHVSILQHFTSYEV